LVFFVARLTPFCTVLHANTRRNGRKMGTVIVVQDSCSIFCKFIFLWAQ
jgi:hypothetical protein